MRKILVRLKAIAQGTLARLRKSVEESARVQTQINSARDDFYRKHPEAFIRRGIL